MRATIPSNGKRPGIPSSRSRKLLSRILPESLRNSFRPLSNKAIRNSLFDIHFQEVRIMTTNTRREFLKQAAIGAAALAAYPPPAVVGANDRVRVGMIGVGGRGEELLKEVLQVPNAHLVAIADVYSRRRDTAKQMAPGIQTFDDHRRLLDMKDLDGVIVASPLHIHARHFLDTLAAGKDLYAEKTLAWSIPEAEQCLEAAKKSDRVIQVGLQHESSGSLADARKWIKDGI